MWQEIAVILIGIAAFGIAGKVIARARKQMTGAAKKFDFLEAAQYRDEMLKL